MTCYHPLLAYKLTDSNGNVKVKVIRQAVFDDDLEFVPPYYHDGYLVQKLNLPCGKCIGCRLENSRQWAIRCIHEAQMYSRNAFLTLTYDNAHLPEDMSLHKEHLQKFWKRLRKYLGDQKIRYYACGEYGSKFERPHYHACVFNYWPDDAKLWSIRGGSRLFVSPTLAKLWPFGFHSVGEVTFDSAAYCARYILKKVNGDKSEEHYKGREPEFVVMSRRPGIGHDWLMKYHSDVYGDDCTIPDYVVVRDNFKCRPPRYYDKIYDVELDGDMDYLRNIRMDELSSSVSLDILHRKELYKELDLLNLKRRYEGY